MHKRRRGGSAFGWGILMRMTLLREKILHFELSLRIQGPREGREWFGQRRRAGGCQGMTQGDEAHESDKGGFHGDSGKGVKKISSILRCH